ncbi:hypothetical protein OS493_006075 [Desmophyllum pertusum]|uniref:Uncharacterized protein n=1 Tax=Desmophyllum pertusum TaxID=174260 RepID=A0A9X0CG37_9CNID|nr:hypothetical protein OS493_006075 [Desmophyllum pertusum]
MDGHVLRLEFSCKNGHRIKWSSSSILGNKYTANCRMIHGFSSCGILESQYQGFAEAAKIGNVGDKYIDYVYGTMGYMQTVLKAGDDCMTEQIHEVQNTDSYQQRNGATVITDCRHDSTANAYHSTVAMLSYETKHVVAVQTVTKEVFRSSQTHEFEAMQQIIPAVQAKGLTVIEVAHDFVLKIKNWLLTLNIQNSFDTWHGTKGVAKAMKEISCGAQKWEGEKWFAELSDKQASVKRHFYYSMKNCTSPDNLRRRLLTILDHYRAITPIVILTRNCHDTYWVESFNNVILIYCPKRIHFADRTFNMRIALAVMDWN